MDIWFTYLPLLLQVPCFSHQPIILLCLDLLQLVTDITPCNSFASHKPNSTQFSFNGKNVAIHAEQGTWKGFCRVSDQFYPFLRLSGMDFRGKNYMKAKHCRMTLLSVNIEVEVDEQMPLVFLRQEAWTSQKPVEFSGRASPKCVLSRHPPLLPLHFVLKFVKTSQNLTVPSGWVRTCRKAWLPCIRAKLIFHSAGLKLPLRSDPHTNTAGI